MKKKATAIERYKAFYENTTDDMHSRLRFNDQLGDNITEERHEIEEDDCSKEDWIEMASNMPNNNYEK